MSTTAGWPSLARLAVRRDRIRLALWTAGVSALVLVSAASIVALYDTPERRATYARLARASAAVIVQAGPGFGLDDPTVGAILMNETSMWTLILAGVLAILTVIRHTRAEEDDDRVALVRSAPVGRNAPAVAAIVTATGALLAIATINCVGLIAIGLPWVGTVAFGASIVLTGMTFGAVALVCAQVASTSRATIGSALACVAAAFTLRAIGDVGNGALSWLSPIGWGQAVRPYADEDWWVLLLPAVTTVILTVAANRLAARRDLGSGLRRPRAGRARGRVGFATPAALAMRLHRGAIVGWTCGAVLLGLLYGAIASEAESMLRNNPDLADFLSTLDGASITDAFLATAMLVIALAAAGATVATIGRLRAEETSGRAELLLCAPIARTRWVLSHARAAGVAMSSVLVLGGAATGVTAAITLSEPFRVAQLVFAALLYIPATAVLAGFAMLVFATLPRWTVLGWSGVALVAVVGLFGEVLDLSQWMRDLSPFEHVPRVPAGYVDWQPIVALSLLAAALLLLAIDRLGARDIPRA